MLGSCLCAYSLTNTHPGICDLEFPKDILGHVVFSHRINNKVLIASRALCGPVLVTLLLWTEHREPPRLRGKGVPRSRGLWDRMGVGKRAQGYVDGKLGYRVERHKRSTLPKGAWCPPWNERGPGGRGGLTLPISRSLVSMTMMVELCSQSMRQKSSVLSARGPCVAM